MGFKILGAIMENRNKKIERIKKGLECCSPYPTKCDECPYRDEVGGSCHYVITDAKDLLEESVVLTKEEYDELKRQLGNYISDQGILLQQIEGLKAELKTANKNTAEKIINGIMCTECDDDNWQDDQMFVNFCNKVVDKLEGFAKEYGVEIED